MIPLAKPTFGAEELAAVEAALDSGWVAGQGPRGATLEKRFTELCETAHAVALANCTAALHLALLSKGVGPGDEVLVADYTYPATGHSVLYTGATPVFVDIRPDTATIDPAAAESAVGARTVGIIAVDTLGQCADYDALGDIADRHGLFLIEDAAAAAGATYRGRPAGSLADIACFSLHARKGITSGEGGILVTDDEAVANQARKQSCFGVESAFERQAAEEFPVPRFDMLGYNYKLSDIQAAIAIVQLTRLPELLKLRRRIADYYFELLRDVPGVSLPVVGEERDHTWQTFAVTLDRGIDRGVVAMRLRNDGVGANIGTFASHLQPVYGVVAPCETSADIFARHLAIPMHAGLTEAEVEQVAVKVATAVAGP